MVSDIVEFFKKAYYRYTLISGIYTLTPAETTVIHTLMAVTSFFLIRYTYSFASEFGSYFKSYIEGEQSL